MSGGVDSAVAALLVGEDAIAVTLELWRDVENDAAASCCSADAVRLARSVAHGMGLPHFTLDLRPEFRAGVVEPFLAGYARGRDAEPVRPLQRPRAARRDARVRRRARRVVPGHRPLRAGHVGRPAARRRRSGQGPGVHARGAVARVAGADAVPAGRADQAARCARWPPRPGCRSRRRADSQDLCFLAGVGKARFLARHGGLEDAPGRDRAALRRGRGRAPRRAPLHGRAAQGARRGRGRAAVRAADRRARGSSSARATSSASIACRVRGARLHRPGSEVDAVRLRYHSRAVPCRVVGEGPRLELELGEPFHGAAPGQTACLLRGDVVVGCGTIAAERRRTAAVGRWSIAAGGAGGCRPQRTTPRRGVARFAQCRRSTTPSARSRDASRDRGRIADLVRAIIRHRNREPPHDQPLLRLLERLRARVRVPSRARRRRPGRVSP